MTVYYEPKRQGLERLLLRQCLSHDDVKRPRPSARVRLEEALGPALAQRLVSSLSLTTRP
jgi:hypothetical protein